MQLLSVIPINIDPVAVTIGSLAIHWYGILYAVAFVAGYRFGALPHLTPRGVSRADAERLLTYTIIAGLIGARLLFVVQQPDLGEYARHPIRVIAVWEGGMDFFGAIFAGVATVAYFTIREHRNFWLYFDAAVLFAVIGQPIGRIGNIINGDILGPPSTVPWATAYYNPHAVLQACCERGVPYHPAAAYEALATIAIGVVLFWLLHRKVRDGVLGITYFGLYAASQFALFFVRSSEPVIGFGLKQSQFVSLAMLVVLLPALVVIWRRTRGDTGGTSGHGIERSDLRTAS